MNVGEKIKTLRLQKGMTLKELSDKSSLSIGFLSQLERGLTTIAVDSLENLSNILEVPLTYFFDIPQPKASPILRSYEREIFDIQEGGFITYCLSTDLKDKYFVPRLTEVLPQKNREEEIVTYTHKGEEFVYVLEGILTAYINNEKYELYPGDSMHINSNVPHNWANYTNKRVRIVSINIPNEFKEE